MFSEKKILIQRVMAEVYYHAAYNYWGLKGVIAERWAHGPLFGAFGDTPEGTVLFPEGGSEGAFACRGVYGLKTCQFHAEGQDDWAAIRASAGRWFDDVYTVLKPKRTVRANAQTLYLHPITDPVRATQKLVDKYMSPKVLELFPEASLGLAVGVQGLAYDGDGGGTSIRIGAIGPPHHGELFAPAHSGSRAWYMGIEVTKRVSETEGIEGAPSSAMRIWDEVVRSGDQLSRTLFPEVV